MAVRLITRDRRIAKLVSEFFRGDSALGSVQHESPEWKFRPARADYVLTAGQLHVATERYAASVGAMPVVIPEGLQYLADKATVRHALGETVILLGIDYAKVSV